MRSAAEKRKGPNAAPLRLAALLLAAAAAAFLHAPGDANYAARGEAPEQPPTVAEKASPLPGRAVSAENPPSALQPAPDGIRLPPGQAASLRSCRRIVSLAPSLTEILYAIGCGHRLAGRSTFSTWPPEAASLPDVGAYNRPSAEAIASLRPDLCIALRDGTPERTVRTLRRMGIPVLVADIRSFETLAGAVRMLGRELGAEEKASAAADGFQRTVQSLRRAPAPDAPRVLFQLQRRPAIAAGPLSFAGSLLEAAGARNAVQSTSVLYPLLGREDLRLLAPDVVIIAGMGDPALDALTAGDWEGRAKVFTVDSDIFTRPSLRSADALRQLTVLLHGSGAAEKHD